MIAKSSYPTWIAFATFLTFSVTSCTSSSTTEENSSIDDSNVNSQETIGLTAIQYNFGIACDRIRAGIFEGTADLFREAGTMGEEDGDLDLARIAYQYADSLDNFNQNETFSECENF